MLRQYQVVWDPSIHGFMKKVACANKAANVTAARLDLPIN